MINFFLFQFYFFQTCMDIPLIYLLRFIAFTFCCITITKYSCNMMINRGSWWGHPLVFLISPPQLRELTLKSMWVLMCRLHLRGDGGGRGGPGRHLCTHTRTKTHRCTQTHTHIPTLQERIPTPGSQLFTLRALALALGKFPSLLHCEGKAVNLLGRLNELLFIKVVRTEWGSGADSVLSKY